MMKANEAIGKLGTFIKDHPAAMIGGAGIGVFAGAEMYARHRDAPVRRAITDLNNYQQRLTAAHKAGLPPSQWPRT